MESREVVSLREHLESRCDERTKQYFAAVSHFEDKIAALEKSVADRHEVFQAKMEAELRYLRDAKLRIEGMASQSSIEWTRKAAILAIFLSAVGAVAGVASAIIHLEK